jgi:hypothetical protein
VKIITPISLSLFPKVKQSLNSFHKAKAAKLERGIERDMKKQREREQRMVKMPTSDVIGVEAARVPSLSNSSSIFNHVQAQI